MLTRIQEALAFRKLYKISPKKSQNRICFVHSIILPFFVPLLDRFLEGIFIIIHSLEIFMIRSSRNYMYFYLQKEPATRCD